MKVGIVADDYKVPMFEKELAGAGFQFTKKGPFVKKATTIIVECDKDKLIDLHRICAKVQSKAFHQKQKEN